MRKTTLFIATSLDGYIADFNKSVGWIAGQNESEDMLDTYSDFIQDIDTVIMGEKYIPANCNGIVARRMAVCEYADLCDDTPNMLMLQTSNS